MAAKPCQQNTNALKKRKYKNNAERHKNNQKNTDFTGLLIHLCRK